MQDLIDRVVAAAEGQALATTQQLTPADGYPDVTLPSGQWKLALPGKWVSGFFGGLLWQLHSLTGKQQWRELAQTWQAGLANRQRGWISQRDLGFIYQPTFAHSYSVTNSSEDLRQALAAAEALSWAFNPDTGTVESWQGWLPRGATNLYKQLVIVDFLVNVQMLLWGAKHVGPPNAHTALRMDTDPAAAWRDMAISHARATAKNHLRPDGSSYHVVEYNPENRPPFINKRYTYQGYADESVWARGQSWALLGFALMYAETGLPEFLDTAKKVTDRWLQLLAAQPGAPGDFVPLWDYSAPFDPARDGPRDSSAAGIASLALLTLAEVVGTDSTCGQRYLCAGVRTLAALAGPKYLAQPGEGFAALFKHAVANFPDSYGVDVGIIYGDYYGLSAFAKCAQMQACREYVL